MTTACAKFHKAMEAVYAARMCRAEEQERASDALLHELTPGESERMRIALNDPLTVELFRAQAWSALGGTLPAPKAGWPKDETPETMWRKLWITR